MPSRLKYAFALIVVAALCAAVGYLARDFLQRPSTGLPATTPGERLEQLESFGEPGETYRRSKIAALGRLEPKGGVIEIGGTMGDRLKSLEVDVSQVVETGDVLGYLESYDESHAQVQVIESQLADAKARLAAETEYAQALIKRAEVGRREAVELGPLQVAVQKAKVRIAEAQFANARRDWQRMQGVSGDTISQQVRDRQQLLVRQAEEQLSAEQAALDQAATASDLNIAKATAKLTEARANLDRVESTVQIKTLEAQLVAAEAALDRSILTAPSPGRILDIMTRPGERITQMPILSMGDTSVMFAAAEVYETDVPQVKVGQRALVSSGALNKKLAGRVSQIGLIVGKNQLLHVDPAADVDARVVEVMIRLDDSDAAAGLTNLQVDVEIFVE